METWVPVSGFETAYEVSDLGRVRSLERRIWCNRGEGYWRTISPRILKANPTRNGYLIVGLHADGCEHKIYVHHLVATHFHGPRPDGFDCMHLDADKRNNRSSNLRWGTRSENIQQTWDDGLREHVRDRVCIRLTST